VAVVIGDWHRVEMLDRRLLRPPKEEGKCIENQSASRSCSGGSHVCIGEAASCVEPTEDAEIHEITVRLTHDDRDLPVRLFVLDCCSLDGMVQEPVLQTARLPGGVEQPNMWCLAEFVVAGTRPVLYDEDQSTVSADRDPLPVCC